MPDLVVPGLIAGLFALLGAFAGAALTRRTEYEKWLRQERTLTFATLLRELHETRLYATTAYYDEPGTEREKSIKVTEAFTLLQKHVSVARLFISERGREEVSNLINELWVNCTVEGGPVNRSGKTKELMQKIQVCLERELNYMSWKVRWPFK